MASVRRAAALVLALMVVGSPAPGQEATQEASTPTTWPANSEGALRFFVDSAGFRGVQGYGLQEFYILLDGRELQFVPEAGRYVAQIDLKVTLKDASGEVAGTESWTRDYSVANLRELREAGGAVRDLMGFSLPPGTYEVILEVADVYGDQKGRADGRVVVPDFEAPGIGGSDPLLASGISRGDDDGRFNRNGWTVTPKVTRLYGVESTIEVYHEVYHLAVPAGDGTGTFDVRYVLTDEGGFPMGDPVDRRYQKVGESAVLVDSISTRGLPGGRYQLQITAIDRETRSYFVKRAEVLIRPPEAAASDEAGIISETQRANLRYYRDIRYVASDRELKIYRTLTGYDARDKFLKVFWQKLDPSPGTALNERLIEHIRRMRHAENNFTGGHGQTGIDSDKGRIYVKYGPPSDREYRSAVDSTKPYEVWTYDTQGMHEFVFRDRRGIGVYELVHSTYPGELYNPNWQDEI